ncbi:MAG: hypothetical protein ACO3AG_00740 [Fluviibacter sp.]
MQNASGQLYKPYIPYGYTQNAAGEVVKATDASGNPINPQRIADFTSAQKQVQGDILKQQTPSQYGQASDIANKAGLAALTAGNYTPGQFNFQQISPEALKYFQMEGPQSFTDAGTSKQYMSPYMQDVLEVQKQEALRDARRTNLLQNLGAARQGTYGGSGQILAGLERERNLNSNLANIQATGMQRAFENAQGQFNTEQSARQNAAMKNLDALLGTQRLGAEQSLTAQQANQQYGFEAQKAAEASRQFANQQGLAGLGLSRDLAQTLGNLGQSQSQADLARLGFQQSTAAQQQALNQQYLDQQYQDFLNQRDYQNQQLQLYSGLLHGVPVSANTTTTATVPGASLGSQIMGAGVTALGAYNMLKGG